MRLWAIISRHKAGHILIVFACVQIACVIAALLFPVDFTYSHFQYRTMSVHTASCNTGERVGLLMIGEFDLSVGPTSL